MPAFLAALVLLFGTPLVVVAALPASLLLGRLMRSRTASLSRLYLSPDAAANMLGRLRLAARTCTGALILGALVLAALLFVPLEYRDRRMAPVIVPIACCVAMFVALVGLLASRRSEGGVPSSRPERTLLTALLVPAGAVLVGILAAGLVSVPDPPSVHFMAFPSPSITNWQYDPSGRVTDVEYSMHGVTAPWPGWYFGLPLLACLVPLVAAAAVGVYLVRRWTPKPPDAAATDDTTRMLVSVVLACVAGIGCLVGLGFVLTMGGPVLIAVSLEPQPLGDLPPSSRAFTHQTPLYAAGLAAQFSWLALIPAALILSWLAVLATRELHEGAKAARRVLEAPAG